MRVHRKAVVLASVLITILVVIVHQAFTKSNLIDERLKISRRQLEDIIDERFAYITDKIDRENLEHNYVDDISPNNLSVLWYTSMEDRDEEASGFIKESLNFMLSLHDTLDLGWYAGCSLSDIKQHKLFMEFSYSDQTILQKLLIRGAEIYNELPYKDNVIAIVFERPYWYKKIFENLRMKHALYKIGRAMFETDWIPNAMTYPINEYLDEVWVPTAFAKDVFKSAGTYIPIKVIGEGFHPAMYSAALNSTDIVANRKRFFPNCRDTDVIFLSVGSMTERKGLDILMKRWVTSFKPVDPACLYIRTKMGTKQRKIFKGLMLRIFELPRLSNEDLVSCYKSADVFVLPTHGEGWGRPIMEAMAAGIPVIVPLWSGITEFVKEEYSIPIHVISLEQAYKKQPWVLGGKKYAHQHHWARINTKELEHHLKWCIEHREELPVIGAKGKAAMHANFTWDVISGHVRARIQEITEEIKDRGIEFYRNKIKIQNRVREEEALLNMPPPAPGPGSFFNLTRDLEQKLLYLLYIMCIFIMFILLLLCVLRYCYRN